MKATMYCRGITTGALNKDNYLKGPLEQILQSIGCQGAMVDLINKQNGAQVKRPIMVCLQGGKQ